MRRSGRSENLRVAIERGPVRPLVATGMQQRGRLREFAPLKKNEMLINHDACFRPDMCGRAKNFPFALRDDLKLINFDARPQQLVVIKARAFATGSRQARLR